MKDAKIGAVVFLATELSAGMYEVIGVNDDGTATLKNVSDKTERSAFVKDLTENPANAATARVEIDVPTEDAAQIGEEILKRVKK